MREAEIRRNQQEHLSNQQVTLRLAVTEQKQPKLATNARLKSEKPQLALLSILLFLAWPLVSLQVVRSSPTACVAGAMITRNFLRPLDSMDPIHHIAPQVHSTAAATANFSQGPESFEDFLDSLPILSVSQRHSAQFECEPKEKPNTNKGAEDQANTTTTLVSLDKKIITPDKRFQVSFQAPLKWTLTIHNVGPHDDDSYFLCQSSGGAGNGRSSQFVGGAKLNVLVPPQIVDADTSASLVRANEFEPATLTCKVRGEPQSQLMWRREDGRPIESDRVVQRFRHQLERLARASELISVDAAELHFEEANRQQAGAYLCIASNGVQPGVSRRMNFVVENCRPSAGSSRREPCDSPSDEEGTTHSPPTSTSANSETDATASKTPRRGSWKTGARNGSKSVGRQVSPEKRRNGQPRESIRQPDWPTELEAANGAPAGSYRGLFAQSLVLLNIITVALKLYHIGG